MSNLYFYSEHPKTCAREDFWGQVKRTVNGRPVSQEQIDMIVDAVATGLELTPQDLLLDLCCGNGALSRQVFAHCAGGVGVDYSEHLIGVAKEYFERPPHETYVLEDVVEHVTHTPDTTLFTKALCYGSFQYLTQVQARTLLSMIRERFTGIARLFIGNLPDKELLGEFYRDREYYPGLENDNTSMIGIWRTREEFYKLAATCGWEAVFQTMPDAYYAAHYRYDAVLKPSK